MHIGMRSNRHAIVRRGFQQDQLWVWRARELGVLTTFPYFQLNAPQQEGLPVPKRRVQMGPARRFAVPFVTHKLSMSGTNPSNGKAFSFGAMIP
jgi:hypothetical protein